MKMRIAGMLVALAAVASAQPLGTSAVVDHGKLIAWFPDGSGVEFSTETTGVTQPRSSHGSLVINLSGMVRVVLDRDNHVLYGYLLTASAGASPDTLDIKLKSLDAKSAEGIRKGEVTGPIPTIAAERDFTGVKIGEAVKLDILYNPATGEKVVDVLRPTKRQPETAAQPPEPAPSRLSFRGLSITVNNQKLEQQSGQLIGDTARIYLPGHGAYYLTIDEPKTTRAFRHMAYVDGKNLDFAIDGDFVQIASKDNVLTDSASGILWIYHDPNFQPESHPESIAIIVANKIEYILKASK